MSLVPAVTELVVAELLYLGYEQAEKPAYLYIHSAGSMGKDKDGRDEVVGVDNEAYAIIDTRRYIKPKIHTVAVGKTYGNAALILAAGDKGCRWALPNAQIATAPPRLNRMFNTSTDVQVRANEVDVYNGGGNMHALKAEEAALLRYVQFALYRAKPTTNIGELRDDEVCKALEKVVKTHGVRFVLSLSTVSKQFQRYL